MQYPHWLWGVNALSNYKEILNMKYLSKVINYLFIYGCIFNET